MSANILRGAVFERRGAERFNIYLPVLVRTAGDEKGLWHRAYTINISSCGACIFSTRPWRLHQVVDLCIGGHGTGRLLFVHAWVVRIDMLKGPEWGWERSYAVGVQFDEGVDMDKLCSCTGHSDIMEFGRAASL